MRILPAISGRWFLVPVTTLCALFAGFNQAADAQGPAPPTNVRVYYGNAVAVSVSPATVTVQPGATVQFSANVIGTSNASIEWRATGGTISTTGRYTAGATPGAFTVTATLSGSNVSGSAAVTVPSTTGPLVDISPGQDIQGTIATYPNGTGFRLMPGVHRVPAPLTPKGGNVITGAPGAILSGARLLTTFSRSGSAWTVDGQTQQGPTRGECRAATPRCTAPEDLFIDDVVLQHVASVGAGGPGKWFFDYAADRIYIWDDPTGRRVETSVTRHAVGGNALNVTISGLIIEKFANPAQSGAIDGSASSGWKVQDNEIRFNHGYAVRIGPLMQVRRNKLIRNGQLGIGGVGDNVLIEDNEIGHNNYAGYEPGWEAGGSKFSQTRTLVVRRNFVHHNDGPGLWTDWNNIDTTYDQNTIEDNAQSGIFHEVSYAAVIRNNTVRRNGFNGPGWLYGAGILVAHSPDVEVYGNTVEGNRNGITAIQQNRGTGAYGLHLVQNLSVHDNIVTMATGVTGVAQDVGDNAVFTSRNNVFQNNTYYLNTNATPFEWMNAQITDSRWRSYNHDTTGLFVR